MCVAYPGKVTKIEGHIATVDFGGSRVRSEAGLVDIKTGDNVLVHAGCIIQKLSPLEADDMRELFKELEALEGERETKDAG